MQVIKRMFLWVVMALVACGASAQVQQARGKATVSYQGKVASPDDKARAAMAAQLKAIEYYYAEAGQSEAENFDAVREQVISNPDRFILDSTVLAEEDNPDKRQYTVAVRVSLNVANLRNAVKSNSSVVRGGVANRSPLAFMFVSRQVASSRAYDDRVHQHTETSEDVHGRGIDARSGTEGEDLGKSHISTNATKTRKVSTSVQTTSTRETGGSTTRRATETSYQLIPSANLVQVFTSNFSKAGFKVNEAAMIEPYTGGRFKVTAIENDYKSGMDLKPATLASLVDGMRYAHMAYVALGTLDVGLPDKDPNTGLFRVGVTVNAKLLDIGAVIPETAASVGPVQYAGLGPTEDEARTAALKLAAESAAHEMTSQITNLGLH